MDKIVVLISMLYLGSSLSAFAEQNISNEKVTLPGQMAEGQVDFLKEEKSALVPQTFSLPTKSESEPTIISEPKNEEDEKQTSSVETFESDMPQITTDSKVSNPDSTLSSSTDVSDELKRGNELESLPSVETTPLIESSPLISDAVNNKTIAEPMPEVVAIEPKSEKIEEQAPLLGATDNSLNVESRIQEEANFPQLTTGHLDVLREIKDRANIPKKVITINDIPREKLELTPTFKYIIYNSKAPDKNTIERWPPKLNNYRAKISYSQC